MFGRREIITRMNDSFESIRSRVLTTTRLADINYVFNMVVTHERQQSCSSGMPKITLIEGSGNGNNQNMMPKLPS